MSTTKIIAVGNPGAGKSTLLNSLGGEVLFKSGLKVGSGVTYQLDEKENANGHFLDTPGLADEELRKQAGKAISKGLRMGGQFKVLFFVTELGGRVVQQDATTIKLVHEAAPEIGDQYGIIVNMVEEGVLEILNNSETKKHDFLNALFAGIPEDNRCIYKNIYFVGEKDELVDEENVVVCPDNIIDAIGLTFRKFIDDSVPEISISEEKVNDINVENFTELTRKLEEMAKEMKLKDEKWKEERRQFETQRIIEAEEQKKKMEELLKQAEEKYIAIKKRIKAQEEEEKARILQNRGKTLVLPVLPRIEPLKETEEKNRLMEESKAQVAKIQEAESGEF